jgi:putative membrane protein
MWLFWLAIFVIVALAIHLAVRSMKKSEPRRESPQEILKRRYARGEIDREEYERAMEDLRQF